MLSILNVKQRLLGWIAFHNNYIYTLRFLGWIAFHNDWMCKCTIQIFKLNVEIYNAVSLAHTQCIRTYSATSFFCFFQSDGAQIAFCRRFGRLMAQLGNLFWCAYSAHSSKLFVAKHMHIGWAAGHLKRCIPLIKVILCFSAHPLTYTARWTSHDNTDNAWWTILLQ